MRSGKDNLKLREEKPVITLLRIIWGILGVLAMCALLLWIELW